MVDVDGLIVAPADPRGWSATLEADLGLRPDLLQTVFFAPHWSEIVHGRAGLHERRAPVLRDIAPHLTSAELCRYWFDRDSRLDHDLLGEIAALRGEGVAVHLATVQEHERARYLWESLRLSDRFEAMHYSADMGCAKPADAFFAEIERRTGFPPSEMFFVDDGSENVDAAQRRGWPAAVWTGKRRLSGLLEDARGA
jgi:putative hydrolase of the HAD superfamily